MSGPACPRYGIGAGFHWRALCAAGADVRKAWCAVSEEAERPTVRAGLPTDSLAQRARRQRRPTGAPPPLPHPITITTTAWVLLAVVILTGAFLISERTSWLRLGDRADTWFLRLLAEVRVPWLTEIARAIKTAGSGWAVTV